MASFWVGEKGLPSSCERSWGYYPGQNIQWGGLFGLKCTLVTMVTGNHIFTVQDDMGPKVFSS